MKSRFSVVIMSSAGVLRRPLPDVGELTIGRAPSSDILLDDAQVSRCHALLRVGEQCAIVDTGSRNGIVVGTRRLRPKETAAIVVGEMITIGSSVLTLQRAAPESKVFSQAEYEARFEEARARCLASGLPFAHGELRFEPGPAAHEPESTVEGGAFADAAARTTAVDETLGELLRPEHVVGLRAPGVYGLILAETSRAEAEALAARIRARLAERGHAVVVRIEGGEAAPTALSPVLERIASGTINVLVRGETGAGKEVMARALHERSPRASGPLVCLNCAAFSETLLEGELFGYEKGAFTGAAHAKAGLLELAQGGTLFLDEVGEMPPPLQAKLLRVLEQREVWRIGALKPRPIDARFIAATNRDLDKEIAAGRFREDLYFRLNGITVHVPPLRERPDEIEPLARKFLAQASAQAKRPIPPALTPQAVVALRAHSWPGNVRELRNLIERAFLLSGGEAIRPEHLAADRGPLAFAPRPDAEDREDYERKRIVSALEKCGGNQTHAAKLLGVSRRTLITWMEQHGLPRPRKRGDQ